MSAGRPIDRSSGTNRPKSASVIFPSASTGTVNVAPFSMYSRSWPPGPMPTFPSASTFTFSPPVTASGAAIAMRASSLTHFTLTATSFPGLPSTNLFVTRIW